MIARVAIVSFAAALAVGCAKEIPDPPGDAVDFESPKSVVSQIFWAARTGNTSNLASLCSPSVESSVSVIRVCQVTKDSPHWDSFVENFAAGKLNGEPRVAGDSAVQKFLYGPKGATPETIDLVRVNGRWQLKSF